MFVRIFTQPLLHFTLIAVAVFWLNAQFGADNAAPTKTIEISAAQLQQLRGNFVNTWRRPPSPGELERLVEDFIQEEIYYREALALSLEQNDKAVRLRLRQKMQFVGESQAAPLDDVEEEAAVRRFYDAHRQNYQGNAQFAFSQLLIPPGADAGAALDKLNHQRPLDNTELQPLNLLPARMALSTAEQIDAVFGEDFHQQLLTLPAGQWRGPVNSPFGRHLVRLDQRVEAEEPVFANIQSLVKKDWQAMRRKEAEQQFYASLRQQYRVSLPAVRLASVR